MSDGGKLLFRSFENDKNFVVKIEDTSGGIDEKILNKIFDPFFTTKEKGVGLGLSIAHKIVSWHSGDLSVESRNENIVFALHLPKDQ